MADKKLPIGQIAFTLTALGIAFWVGRVSTPEATSSKAEASESASSDSRPTRRASSAQDSLGAGDQAITTARQLHDINNHQGGTATTLALAKMNTSEMASLARDLAEKAMSTPGYLPYSDISQTFTRWAELDPDAALKFALLSKPHSFQSSAISSIFTTLAKTDLALARVKLSEVPDQRLRQRIKLSLSQALAKADPEAWLQELKSDPVTANQIRPYSITSIVQEWAFNDPAAAAARIQHLPSNLQLNSLAVVAKIWAASDPQAALSWAQALSKTGQRNKALSSVLGGMAAHDPEAALTTLDTLSTSTRPAGISAIFSTLVNKDFETALAKAAALAAPIDRRAAYGVMISNILNAKQLSQLTEQLPAGAVRNDALKELGGRLASFAPQDANKFINTYPSKDQIKLKLQMINYLSYSDPHRAMELYKSLPAEKVKRHTFSSIIQYIAKNDPEEALQIVLKEESASQQSSAIGFVFSQLAATDPEGAKQHLSKLPQGKTRNYAIQKLAETWAKADADSAIQWAETLPDSEKNKAFLSIIPQMAKSAPAEAASHMETLLKSTPEKIQSNFSNAIYHMMDQWVEIDPSSAGSWVAGLEDGTVKTQAIENLASQWYQEDSDGVADWIDHLPQGKNRDKSISSISFTLQQKDPATAFAWAESIGNEKSRIKQLSYIVRSWKSSNPKKALKKVETADLTSDERTRLMKHFE